MGTKRPSMKGIMERRAPTPSAAAKATGTGGGEGAAAPPGRTAGRPDEPLANTGIRLPISVLRRLDAVAWHRRAERGGKGRASVNEIILECIERALPAMEKEAEGK